MALILKVNTPTKITEFRPISLRNVVYKLATKVITNWLKKILTQIIFDIQSAFTSSGLLTDNILISYEVFHSMLSQSCRNGSMAIKVDMSQAYD